MVHESPWQQAVAYAVTVQLPFPEIPIVAGCDLSRRAARWSLAGIPRLVRLARVFGDGRALLNFGALFEPATVCRSLAILNRLEIRCFKVPGT
jgi:hypothetical protein